MKKTIAAALAVPVALLAFSACGSDDDSEPKSGAEGGGGSSCADAVGQPLADQYPTSEDNGPACAPGTAVLSNGCYPGGEYDETRPLISWSADGGMYFARTGDNLQFIEGEPTITEMSDAAGCGNDASAAPEETTSAPVDTTEAANDAPAEITVDCPEGLEDGIYTRQADGKYVFQDESEYAFTLAEIEAMNDQYGCEVVG